MSMTYTECPTCDVLISRVPAAVYADDYYYFKNSRLSRASLARADLLWKCFQPYFKNGRCLDIGCNDGAFVVVAARRGLTCEGVDLNEHAVRFAKANSNGQFWTVSELGEREFECVTAFDVIEHCDIVDTLLDFVARCLAPGGRLILTTPNKNSKWRTIFGHGWHGFGIPQYHRFVLSQTALRKVLEAHGFKIETMFTRPPIERHGWKLLLASGYRLKNTKLKKACVLPLAVLKYIYGTLRGGAEDTLCVVADRTNVRRS
jgi:SAM-dependent methyltransferase